MSTINEKPEWVPEIYKLTTEAAVLGFDQLDDSDGPSNIQAQQLAKRTSYLKSQVESIQDAREYTFFITDADPDGTIAGLAATASGQTFRVAQGLESVNSFIFYLNQNGVAVAIAAWLGDGSIDLLNRRIDNLRQSVHFLAESADAFAESNSAIVRVISETMERVFDITSSGNKILTLDNDGILAINKIVDASPPNTTLTVKNNGVEVLSFTVLPGETLNVGKNISPWFLVSSLSGKRPSSVLFQGSVARLIFTKEEFPDVSGIDVQPDQYRAADKTYRFISQTANGAATSTVPCVSNTTTGDVQFVIPTAMIIAAGYPATVQGTTDYFIATYPDLNIWCRPASTVTTRWNYDSLSVVPLSSGSVEIFVDSSVSSVDLSVYSGAAVVEIAPRKVSESLFRQSSADKNLLFSGHSTDLTSVYSSVESFLSIESMAALSNGVSGRITLNVNGVAESKIYFPGFGSLFVSKVLSAPFESFSLKDCVRYRIAETTATVVRAQFTIPAAVVTAFNTQTSEYIVDVSGVFAPSTYSIGSGVTEKTVSGTTTATPRVIQINVLISEMTAAGYDATNSASIEAYIRNIAAGCLFLAYTGVVKSLDVSEFFSRRLPAGTVTLSYGNNNAAGHLRIVNDQSVKPTDVGRYVYKSADILNDTAYDYTGFPLELKVSFIPGSVVANNSLYLVDNDGIEIPCQFADEFHPNTRHQSNLGYNADGTLGSGSVFFYDTLPAGSQKYYELKSYARERASVGSAVITRTPSLLTVTFGGYIFVFSPDRSWCIDSITDAQGNVTRVQYTPWCAAYNTSVLQSQLAVNASVRVITSGPIFVEIESTSYSPAVGKLALKALRAVTRTRIFKSGRTSIRTMFKAMNEIPVNTLWGTHTRLSLPDIGLVPDTKKYFTLLNTASTGKVWSYMLLRGTGDTHRDGTAYGPNRPNYWNVLNPSSTSTRLYGGWQFTATNDYSLLNWPVKKDWTWINEFVIDPETRYATELDALTYVYNRPGGRLGTPVFPGTIKRRLLQKFEDYCVGSMEWFNSPAAAAVGGATSVTSRYYCHIWDVYNYTRYGKGSLATLLANFKAYCSANWGSFANIGASYTSGAMGLQFVSRLILPVYHWMYKAAEKDGNTVVQADLSASLATLADAMVLYLSTHSGVALTATDGGGGNSNSNATAMRILALAIYMGKDTSGSYAAALNTLQELLSGPTYNYVRGVVTEGPDNVLNAYNWLHYQAYSANNYLIACDLAGLTPAYDLVNYSMQAQSGLGGYNEIDYCVSESRRGQFNTVTFMSYPYFRAGRASALAAMEDAWGQFEDQHHAVPGMTRRMYQFDGTTNNQDRYEVSFNVAVLCDTMLKFHS
ncbi:hypothetical protein [Serratia fonticola]|uniref:hypothetical protein n=1 Tax=Serratia fonticola TaxID=47917 RepID=UPI0013773CC6|nr:hypothetical protein [Serratia fonticola]NCG53832.1 hypothetical protein [Serratia fonticola]